jgi:hypothetical protein
MKNVCPLLLPLIFLFFSCNTKTNNACVLVFSKTTGYRHSSIAVGKLAIQKLGKENGFDVNTTENADFFNDDNLKKYSAVIFLNTIGDVLNYKQQAVFEKFIQASGGGLKGIFMRWSVLWKTQNLQRPLILNWNRMENCMYWNMAQAGLVKIKTQD